jgi:GNAT superfamily N-acetyltransferase
MSDVVVKPVATRGERKQFLMLPWKLYRDDPNWIPPLRLNQEELVGYRRHPFYDDAEAQTFLAFRDGQPVGRVSAIVNHAHNRRYKEKRGFFGFFETIDDRAVAHGLLDAARDWLGQRGIQAVRGPMNPSFNYEIGLLIDGFDSPPTFMMTYNPPFYAPLLESYGFQKTQDLYAYWGHMNMLESLDKKLAFIVEEATQRFKFDMRRLDTSRFREEVAEFLRVYNAANQGHWGFVPLSDGEIKHMSASLRYLVVPEMTSVAEVDGKVVGAAFGMLDYNPRIKQSNGRLFPFGFLRLLFNRRQIKRVRMVATLVVPEYQMWGLGLVLLARLVPDSLAWGIEEGEFSWVAESNRLSKASLERGGAKRIKTYRIYDYAPGEAHAAG